MQAEADAFIGFFRYTEGKRDFLNWQDTYPQESTRNLTERGIQEKTL